MSTEQKNSPKGKDKKDSSQTLVSIPGATLLAASRDVPVDDLSIIDLIQDLIESAYESRASDIHIDPQEDRVGVSFRVDGIVKDICSFSKKLHPSIISRLKVLSGLRTDEHQASQDGRIKFTSIRHNLRFDIRLSIMPTYFGENAVMRLLVEIGEEFTIDNLGFCERDLAIVKEAISDPYGMILSTGPTGSGKTTTLYTMIKVLNSPTVTVITIEDPIEYSMAGITQVQVNHEVGIDFANGLRSILRQDPNIIMVGEIRDTETANIAVNAALTGHLLLSTLHTNNASTTLPRLIDMGVEPFLIASTVDIAIGQRLIRRLCTTCRYQKDFTYMEFAALQRALPVLDAKDKFYYGKGCPQCDGTGYKGRMAIYEVLQVTPKVRDAISARENSDEIERIAISEGMTTMLQDGIAKARAGLTSIEEVLRVMHE